MEEPANPESSDGDQWRYVDSTVNALLLRLKLSSGVSTTPQLFFMGTSFKIVGVDGDNVTVRVRNMDGNERDYIVCDNKTVGQLKLYPRERRKTGDKIGEPSKERANKIVKGRRTTWGRILKVLGMFGYGQRATDTKRMESELLKSAEKVHGNSSSEE